jgi:hypothetical protein
VSEESVDLGQSGVQQPDPDLQVESTGNEAVDDVLRSLDTLEGRSVGEHVAVFESAHEALRAALANAGDRPGGPAAG